MLVMRPLENETCMRCVADPLLRHTAHSSCTKLEADCLARVAVKSLYLRVWAEVKTQKVRSYPLEVMHREGTF